MVIPTQFFPEEDSAGVVSVMQHDCGIRFTIDQKEYFELRHFQRNVQIPK